MKKRKFYSNKKRDKKWTEQPKGHKIDFAEKYIGEGSYSDKYDEKRPAYQISKKNKKRAKLNKRLRNVATIALCLVIVGCGYTMMDAYMLRHDKPLSHIGYVDNSDEVNFADIALDISATKVESVSLDNSVMLSSVTNELQANGYTSLVFDAKRSDGTIGYASSLASIDTFSAISNASSRPEASIKKLIENDILPIARISCYKDNVVPSQDSTAALKINDKIYRDKNGNTYLNPNSDSAYSYIKDIITELTGYGVKVFILNECDLPSDISNAYADGFDEICAKLEKDFDYSIKLLQEVDTNIKGKNPETGSFSADIISSEISSIDKLSQKQILFISTQADKKFVKNQLDINSFNCYVIED